MLIPCFIVKLATQHLWRWYTRYLNNKKMTLSNWTRSIVIRQGTASPKLYFLFSGLRCCRPGDTIDLARQTRQDDKSRIDIVVYDIDTPAGQVWSYSYQLNRNFYHWSNFHWIIPDSKVHVAYMGPTLGRQDPGGPHAGHANLAVWDEFPEIWVHVTIRVTSWMGDCDIFCKIMWLNATSYDHFI